MSAIAGVAFLDGMPVEQGLLDRMAMALKHRGQAGWASWGREGVGLVHLMYRNTPESLKETQPAWDRATNLAISADVRLDNRQELAGLLDLHPRQAAAMSDSQLVLQAYARWGSECPTYLLGDFAFAIWDATAKRLFLARDPSSVRALYYCHLPGHFLIFASEIKALLTYTQVPRRLNEAMLAAYLCGFRSEPHHTPYQEISRLPPAHCLVLEPGAPLKLRSYWQLDLSREVRYPNDGEYVQAFLEVLSSAVSSRLRSAYPIGIQLDGGGASAAITCVARQIREGQPKGLLYVYSGELPELVEVEAYSKQQRDIEILSTQGGLEHHIIPAENGDPFGPERMARFDHLPAPELVIDWQLLKYAARDGVHTLLSGAGGDSVIHQGLYTIAELLGDRRWSDMLREARDLGKTLGMRRDQVLWEYGILPLLPERGRNKWQQWRRKPQHEWEPHTLIHPGFAARINLDQIIHHSQTTPHPHRHAALSQLANAHDLARALAQVDFEQTSELAYASGVEVAYPFLDRRVMEFCLGLPGEQKLRGGVTQYLLHAALGELLPPELAAGHWQERAPMIRKVNLQEQNTQRLESLAEQPMPWMEDLLDVSVLKSMLGRNRQDPAAHPLETLQLFRVAALDDWLERNGFIPGH